MDAVNLKRKDGVVATFLSIFGNTTDEIDIENNPKYKELLNAEKEMGATKRIEDLAKSMQNFVADKQADRRNMVRKEKVEGEVVATKTDGKINTENEERTIGD